jgi:hypothetical protein
LSVARCALSVCYHFKYQLVIRIECIPMNDMNCRTTRHPLHTEYNRHRILTFSQLPSHQDWARMRILGLIPSWHWMNDQRVWQGHIFSMVFLLCCCHQENMVHRILIFIELEFLSRSDWDQRAVWISLIRLGEFSKGPNLLRRPVVAALKWHQVSSNKSDFVPWTDSERWCFQAESRSLIEWLNGETFWSRTNIQG